jgi:hypothetical protein
MSHISHRICQDEFWPYLRWRASRVMQVTYLSSFPLILGLASLGQTVKAQTFPVSTYTFTGTNPNTGGGQVAASVVFTVTASGAVTIDVKNTNATATTSNTDALEGVLFDTTLSTKATATTTPTGWAQIAAGSFLMSNSSGTSLGGGGTDINANGGTWRVATLGTGTTTDGLVHNYGVGDTGAYGISAGGGAGAGGIVSSATFPGGPGHAQSGSIKRYPYTDNEATFNLSGITGLTNVSQITNVYFIYNSAGLASPKGVLQAQTPEPGAFALFGASLLTSAVYFRRRKRVRK